MRLGNGAELALEVSGRGPVPLVLIHGYTLSLESWDRVSERLPRCTVYRYDLRGFGRSGRCASYSLDDNVGDLGELLSRLGLERPTIVGHSLGGTIALRFAVQHPGRVGGLVLSNVRPPNVPGPDIVSNAVEERLASYATPEGVPAALRARMPAYFDPDNLSDDDLERFIEHGIKADPAALVALLREMYMSAPTPDAVLARIKVPTLLVYGANDTMTPPALAPALTRHWPRAELVEIADCGHTPMWERPQAWADVVNRFLGRRPELERPGR